MKIHYQNISGEERFLDNVLHIQNINNEMFEVMFNNNKTLCIRVAGIEGIYDEKKGGRGMNSLLEFAMLKCDAKDLEITQLKAKLELCREALQSLVDECAYYIASVGEPTFGKVSAALEAIEGRGGE